MAGLRTRFILSLVVVVRFAVFPSITDGAADDEVNVSLRKHAIQSSMYISPGKAALDDDNTTASCTNDKAKHPWWAVDLEKEYNISRVTITSPDDHRYVKGLDNFKVYVSKVSPTEDSPIVSTDSYTLCGQYNGPVNASQKITVVCTPFSQKFRFLIVRSADASPERLCMAEVAVYAANSTGTDDSFSTTTPPVLKSTPRIPVARRPTDTKTSPGLMNPLTVMLVLSPTIVIAMAYLGRCTSYIAKTLLRKAVRSIRSL